MVLSFDIGLESFLSLTLINFFATASPGPALIIQMKQSMERGFKLGLYYAIGVGVGIGVHLLYIFLGLAQFIASIAWLEYVVILVAIIYFSIVAYDLLRTRKLDAKETLKVENNALSKRLKFNSNTPKGSFWLGVVISAVNPNAIVFMITVFAPLVNPSWNFFSCFIMLIWLSFVCFLYYQFLNTLFSNQRVSKYYFKYRYIFDKIIGVFFIYLILCFGAKLLPIEWIAPFKWMLYF